MLVEAWRFSEKQPRDAEHVSIRGTVPDVLGQPTAVSWGKPKPPWLEGGKGGCQCLAPFLGSFSTPQVMVTGAVHS